MVFMAQMAENYLLREKVEFHSPAEAIALGIGMVHQHFQLVPVMTVAENIVLGAEKLKVSNLI